MMLGPAAKAKEGDDMALRTTMGVVLELTKEVDTFKKEAFDNWQVGF